MSKIIVFLLFFCLIFSSTIQIDSTLIRDSSKSFKWSIIPIASQGQMYNKKYLKSMLFVAGQSYSLNRVLYYSQYEDISNLKMRNKFGWWFLGIYITSMIDAYIDAELSTFPERKN